MKRTALRRTKPLRRVGTSVKKKSNTPTLDKTRGYPRLRRWTCAHCRIKNEPAERKCHGCAIRRATKRTSLKARADAMARELCRLLADGKCARCGGLGSDWAHRFRRAHHSVRWDVLGNSDFLCRRCHDYFGTHPVAFIGWLSARSVDLAALEARANEPWDKDYSRVIADLSAQLRTAREAA